MLAQAKPHVATIPDMYDRDPCLLNCPNGTLDLRTATLREHRREDHLTKLCPTDYRADAQCPTWLEFLDTIFAGDRATIDYLQRLCGYWLTGDVREQILPIFCGKGSNGKSTFVDAVKDVLGGDYAITGDRSLIIAKDREGHSTERMDLLGRRLAVVTETDDHQRFAEAAVKELTGGDAIRGRRMRENTWEYKPTHKMLLVTNHKPRVRATDHAFWRRPKLIHFAVTIADEEQDKVLCDKLKAEASGILAWAVRGCVRWQQCGLAEPESVQKATREYRSHEDTLRQFIDECCVTADGAQVKLGVLRERYARWCKERGEREFSARRFGEYLKSAGFESYHSGSTWYRGIGVSGEAHGEQIDLWSERGRTCDVT